MALKWEGAGGGRLSGSRHRQSQPINRTKDRQEQSPGHSHIGQLEGHPAGVTDDLGPDLDQLLPSARQGPALALPRQDQLPEEVPKVVGQDEEMKPDPVVVEVVARQARSPQRVITLLDPLLCGSPLVVEADKRGQRPRRERSSPGPVLRPINSGEGSAASSRWDEPKRLSCS